MEAFSSNKQPTKEIDIISFFADMSNDEVFTPPKLAKEMVDLLPQEFFSNPNTKFLDPGCKSGIFLKEITKRLIKGLEQQIPDLQDRINHILTQQVYGIAITEKTALLSRRTLYCSKTANGKYSIVNKFKNAEGNIYFERQEHNWHRGRCTICGANQNQYDRDPEKETHAYNFIHTDNPFSFFGDMKFDVIIGNPPYHLSDGGSGNGISAMPLYHEFIKQAKRLNPEHLIMIIPARWYAGGKGLDEFRNIMLNDSRIKKLFDFPKSRDCFPGQDIAGGICYFLWDKNYDGLCDYTTIYNNSYSKVIRKLNQFPIFIRDNTALLIINKIQSIDSNFYSETVFPRNPFGFVSSERGAIEKHKNTIKLISSAGIGFVNIDKVLRNKHLIEDYKVKIGKINPDRAGVNNNADGKVNVINKVNLVQPNEVFTETYLLLDHFKNENNAKNCISYFATKFSRYLINITLSSMNITRANFQFVPVQDYTEPWSDEKLYKKYGLSEEEIAHIEAMIKPMDLNQPDEEIEVPVNDNFEDDE